ncbi:MAG: sugar phosphate isomerase/epimerase [Deltaproteobacteria bacterium]|nr:sugar phosphate isomerase/epimerase [Deltaproteobacteria bacterium]
MKFGLSTCILPRMPLQTALPRLVDLGITRIEYAIFNLIMSSSNGRLKGRYLQSRDAWGLRERDIPTKEIREISSSLGVDPVQIHSADFSLSDPDPHRRMLALERTETMLRICSALGSHCLIVHVGPPQPTFPSGRETPKRMADSLRVLARKASDLGCVIAVENGWQNPYGSRGKDLVEIIEDSDPDHIGACLDTGHSQRVGSSPASMVMELGNHLVATHIHDFDGQRDHIPPFSGNINWDRFLSALAEVGYRKALIGEIDGSEHITKGVLDSKKAMEGLLALLETRRPSTL